MTALTKRFGRLLSARRRMAGLRQAELAEQAGLSIDMIAKLETGATGPSFRTIDRLCAALRIDPAELFTNELAGRPGERRALTDLMAELGKLSDGELAWVSDLIRTALKPRR